MSDCTNRIRAARSRVDRLAGERDALQRQIKDLDSAVEALGKDVDVLGYVSALFRHLIDSEITAAVESVAGLQTEGLREIFFDQDIEVFPEVTQSRGKVSVRFPVRHKDGSNVCEGESMDSFGGSILTIQSILLRITVIFRRGLRPFLLLDETLAAVDNKYVDRAVQFLSILCDRMGLDVLVVTHRDAIVGMAHQAYRVTRKDGEAVFRAVGSKRRRSP